MQSNYSDIIVIVVGLFVGWAELSQIMCMYVRMCLKIMHLQYMDK